MTIRSLGTMGLHCAALAFGLGLSATTSWSEEPPTSGGPATKPVAERPERSVEAKRDAWMRYEDAQVRYEQPRFGGDARLYVREKSALTPNGSSKPAASDRWRVYRGSTLNVITGANVGLASNSDMRGVQQYFTAHTNMDATEDRSRVVSMVVASVEAPGLVYEPGTAGTSRLFVRDLGDREMLYTGDDLAAIVRANPKLDQVSGFPAFRTRVQKFGALSPWTLRDDASTILVVTDTPAGVVVTSYEWRDGRWGTQSHKGPTLADIRANQPGLRAMLIGAKSEPTAQVPLAGNVLPFGAAIDAPPTCLDVQLRLEGRGMLVTDVTAGSPASTLGLQDYDVIVEYDGRPVSDRKWARSQLDSWRPEAKTKVVVLRRGERVTLGS